MLISARLAGRVVVVESDRKPHISDELIDYLEKILPDKLPRNFPGEFMMGKLFGEVSVVRHLKALRDEQRENMLSSQLKGN